MSGRLVAITHFTRPSVSKPSIWFSNCRRYHTKHDGHHCNHTVDNETAANGSRNGGRITIALSTTKGNSSDAAATHLHERALDFAVC